MAVLQIITSADVVTRKKTCQDFLTMAYSKSSFLSDCTKQKAWQVSHFEFTAYVRIEQQVIRRTIGEQKSKLLN